MADANQQGGSDKDGASAPYLVLARKYRPQNFSTFIGQDALVQTLQNAFDSGRIAHAYMLTGVRGVGKTTTARILARALNYETVEGGAKPNLELADEGIHCAAIMASTHVDVIELDAASHTSIDNIREIIESVRYRPTSAPYKVYIIDEVHMLSKSAFNGLLKTLEEPPDYVKFIFATTEIRKVPVTILSRCQRFDLRRVEPDVLVDYLKSILDQEGIKAQDEALALIARAGEGSVRDALSLLDQAIAHGSGEITTDAVEDMLGLVDRGRVITLFEHLVAGQIKEALEEFRAQYNSGADPQNVLSELADFTHLVTRLKLVSSAGDDVSLTIDEKARGKELSGRLSIRVLSRMWQMLVKGLTEVQMAPNGAQAVDMVLVRVAHASDMPTPDELIRKLENMPQDGPSGQGSVVPSGGRGPSAGGSSDGGPAAGEPPVGGPPEGASVQVLAPVRRSGGPVLVRQSEVDPVEVPQVRRAVLLASYADIVELARSKRDIKLRNALETMMAPIAFEQGRVEVSLTPEADPAIVQALINRLKEWTGERWLVVVSHKDIVGTTIKAEKQQARAQELDAAETDPMVVEVMLAFPGAKVVDVRSVVSAVPEDILAPVEENDD